MISGGLRNKGIFKYTQKENPLISIITSVLNNKKYLEQTIQSVLTQTYKNIEYIVIDGGSTDGTLEILNKHDNQIDYWISEIDEGIYFGIDKGIRQATGDYFLVLNSDDYYVSDKVIISLVQHINEQPDIDFFFGNIVHINEKGDESLKKAEIKRILMQNTIPHPSTCVKTKDYIILGGYNLKYRIAADYEFVIRMLQRKLKWYYIDLTMTCFRKGGFSYYNDLALLEYKEILKEHNLMNIKTWYNYIELFFKRKLLKIIHGL